VGSDELFDKFLEEERWKSNLETGFRADSSSTLAIVEHARSEIETSGIISISLWSALVGAVAGFSLSILFFLISRLI
jgi:hypothetical protein